MADALVVHQRYFEALDLWRVWLEAGTKPSNSEQLLLWQLISLTLERRSPGGAWVDLDEKFVPKADDLRAVLDTSKFDGFGAEVVSRRQAVENTAKALVSMLESTDLLVELNGLADVPRWEFAAQLLDGLADSNVGMLYLRKAVTQTMSPLAVAHPEQLIKSALTWTAATAQARRAARAYAHMVLKLLPALLADQKYTAFTDVSLHFIARFSPSAGVLAGLRLEESIDEFRKQIRENPPWWTNEKFAAHVQAVFDVINLGVAIRNVVSDPRPLTMLAAARALSSLVASGSALAKAQFGEGHLLVLSKSASTVIADLNAAYDIYLACRAIYDSSEAARTGDYSVAAGQAIQGVGLATAAATSAWVAMLDAGWIVTGAALVPGLQFLALGALVLVVGGIVLAAYTKDSQFETWLQNCWFGDKWNSVGSDENPDTPMYRSKRVDDTPDIARQVSFWISVFYPLRLTVSTVANHAVTIVCEPAFATRESQVNVLRIDENDAAPDAFTRIPIYTNKIDDTGDPRIQAGITGTPPNERVVDWVATLGSLDWSQGTNPAFDMTGHWIEIEMTLPDRFAREITADTMGGQLRNFTFGLMSRARVKVG